MKSSLLKLALAAIVVCAPVALHAQTDTTNPIATTPVKNPEASTASTKMKKTAYSGTVKSIDASSVVVTTSKGDMTFAISPATKVKVDKKTAPLASVVTGEKVTGSFMKDADGTMTAASIHATSMAK
jgi:hypothetical protein